MKPNPEYHNPDKLTQEQIGKGYRLLLTSEIIDREPIRQIECWNKSRWLTLGYIGNLTISTYRVPLTAWPLPDNVIEANGKLWWKHDGGKMPCGGSDEVELLMRYEDSCTSVNPGQFRWESIRIGSNEIQSGGDIIGWRMVKKAEANDTTLLDRIAELERKLKAFSGDYEELDLELAKTKARLELLEWRKLSEGKPTKEDDLIRLRFENGNVSSRLYYFDNIPSDATHWRPSTPPIIEADPEREAFEKWFAKQSKWMPGEKDVIYTVWQAARKEKV